MRDRRNRIHLDFDVELPLEPQEQHRTLPRHGHGVRAAQGRAPQDPARLIRHEIHQLLHDVVRGEDPDAIVT